MRPVSAELLRVIRGSHVVDFRARLVDTFQVGTNPDGETIPVLGGDVQLDATADVRSTLELQTDGSGWATSPDEQITPYGNELFVERAVVFGDGRREWVSLGYFRIYSVDQDEAPDGPLRVQGKDRMSGIVDARLEQPRQFTASHTLQQVVDSLVLDVYPDATIVTDGETNLAAVAVGRSMVVEEDRYAALRDVVRSVGRVMYWNHRGELFIGKPPDPGAPVFDVDSGEGGVLVKLSRSIDREGVFNAVVARGEAPDTEDPVYGVARDMAPSSPTYYLGRFGKVPRSYSSPLLTTVAQCESAAAALLQQSIGLPYYVDFASVPNPALEPLDPVRVVHPQRVEVHVLDKITIPLEPESPLTSTTREQTDLIIETEGA